MSLEVVDRDPAPAFGGADHGGDGELHGGPLGHKAGDDLGPSTLLSKARSARLVVRTRMRWRMGTRWMASIASRSSAKQATAAGNSRP